MVGGRPELSAYERFTMDRGNLAWTAHVACKDTPIEWWAPPYKRGRPAVAQRWEPHPEAQRLCNECPVSAECLADAEATGDIDWTMRANHGPLAFLKWRARHAEMSNERNRRLGLGPYATPVLIVPTNVQPPSPYRSQGYERTFQDGMESGEPRGLSSP